MNVLIVEDNKPVSLLLSRITEEAGLGYVIAADGEVALRLFGQRDIAMAIIDVELPGLDGYQVARDIRNRAPALPIIIISANAGDAWRQQAFDAGADEFLAKPLRPSELTTLFRRHLNLSPAP
ncbi:MAG: response regulator [Alcanivoracaceae bacterium]